MSEPAFLRTQSFRTEPFKDKVIVLFNQDELKQFTTYLTHIKHHQHGQEGLAKLDDNYGLVKLHSPGTANDQVLYLPVIERQRMGMSWMYMQSVIARLSTQIALSAVTVAGYKPLTESVMFIHLHARIMERIMQIVEAKFGGKLSIVPQPAMDLSVDLNARQWQLIDQFTPRTIADLARDHLMLVDNHVVELDDHGLWSSTSYFY